MKKLIELKIWLKKFCNFLDQSKYLIYLCIINKNIMNEGTQILENEIYSYKTKDGLTCYTPNASFAVSRALAHGTENVYVEKVETQEN